MIKDFFQKSARYWHTTRHLRLVQIIGRVKKNFRQVQCDLSAHQGKSRPKGNWVQPAKRRKSMLGEKRFCFLNECHEITLGKDWNKRQWSKLWLYNLHYFDDLNAIGADTRKDWHHKLIQHWVCYNPPGKWLGCLSFLTSYCKLDQMGINRKSPRQYIGAFIICPSSLPLQKSGNSLIGESSFCQRQSFALRRPFFLWRRS